MIDKTNKQNVVHRIDTTRRESVCPVETSPSTGSGDFEDLQIVVVKEVKWPGTSYKPSTGKRLRVFQLDDTLLRGKFVSHDDRVLHYRSTCSGVVHVWRHNPARNRLRNRWHPHCPGKEPDFCLRTN